MFAPHFFSNLSSSLLSTLLFNSSLFISLVTQVGRKANQHADIDEEEDLEEGGTGVGKALQTAKNKVTSIYRENSSKVFCSKNIVF